jgi:DNA helicase HerA-like ATPase
MVKKSKYRYSTSKQKQSKTRRIIKSILPWISVAIVGTVSFVLLFPELLRLFPSSSMTSLAIFAEKLALALKSFFITLSTNIAFISTISAVVFLLVLVRLLPFYNIDGTEFYTQKKLFLPFYRKIGIVMVSSSTGNGNSNFSRSSYANKIHEAFIKGLSLRAKDRMLAIYKHSRGVSILFPVISKGISQKRVEEQLDKEIIFISNSIENHYDSRIKTLSSDQTKTLVQALNQMKAKNRIESTSELILQSNITDQIYNIFVKKELKDACFIIKTDKRRKESKRIVFDIILLSEDKTTESFILNASGLSRKKSKVIKPNKSFLSLVFSAIRKKESVSIDDIASLVHVPMTYTGGSLPISTKQDGLATTIFGGEDDIAVGRVIDENDLGKEISLNVQDLLLNVEILGAIGRGKTKLVSSIVGQLLEKGISTLVFDIKGEYARTFTDDSRVEIYTIGKPHPLCINIFETADEDDIHNTLLIIEEMLVSSNQEFTPAMKNLFESALLLTHKAPKRNLQVFVENIFKVSRQLQAHSNITYLQQTIDAVLNRLNFIFNPINFEILGAMRTTIDLSLLEKGKSIILDLSQFQRRAARPSDIFLVCNLILKMLYRKASAREMTNQLRYVVVLEEAINIIPNFYHSESSASLITSENNFLLGRTLGIGHITITQMWQSVSNIVHANSATKFVFRSSDKTETIAKALNLEEDEITKIHSLPTQHCFLFFEGSDSAIQIRTLDLLTNPISYAEYQAKMLKKYGRSVFPLLFNNFIDMRTSIYQQSNANIAGRSKKHSSKREDFSQNKLDNFLKEDEKEAKSKKTTVIEKDTLDLISSAGMLPENLICEQLCLQDSSKKSCLKNSMGAKVVKSTIINECSTEEISILLTDVGKLHSLVSAISIKRNLEFDEYLVFCTVKILVFDFISENILTPSEAYSILTKFSPRVEKTIEP